MEIDVTVFYDFRRNVSIECLIYEMLDLHGYNCDWKESKRCKRIKSESFFGIILFSRDKTKRKVRINAIRRSK